MRGKYFRAGIFIAVSLENCVAVEESERNLRMEEDYSSDSSSGEEEAEVSSNSNYCVNYLEIHAACSDSFVYFLISLYFRFSVAVN